MVLCTGCKSIPYDWVMRLGSPVTLFWTSSDCKLCKHLTHATLDCIKSIKANSSMYNKQENSLICQLLTVFCQDLKSELFNEYPLYCACNVTCSHMHPGLADWLSSFNIWHMAVANIQRHRCWALCSSWLHLLSLEDCSVCTNHCGAHRRPHTQLSRHWPWHALDLVSHGFRKSADVNEQLRATNVYNALAYPTCHRHMHADENHQSSPKLCNGHKQPYLGYKK